MALLKWHADVVKKYSFVDDCAIRNGKLQIKYTDETGKQKIKALPLRASVTRLQQTIQQIRKETRANIYGKPTAGNITLA